MPRKNIVPIWLQDRAKEVHAKKQVVVQVLQLVNEFGKTKRTPNTNKLINSALFKCRLTTTPKFTAVRITESIQLIARPKKERSAPIGKDNNRSPIITYGMLKCVETQRKLRHAGAEILHQRQISYPKWYVKPTETLEAAVAILSQQDVDYVPVGQSENEFTAVISWDEVAIKDIRGMKRQKTLCSEVRNSAVFVDESDSVYDSNNLIQKHGYVLVRNDHGRTFAIVRASDLAQELLSLTENFLLLYEIENLVRLLIENTGPTQQDIDSCLEERDRGKKLSVDRMTFSHYCSYFRKGSEIFNKKLMKAGLTVELALQVSTQLEGIRETRNMVMHFHPDENDDGAKNRISKVRDFIRKLANELDDEE